VIAYFGSIRAYPAPGASLGDAGSHCVDGDLRSGRAVKLAEDAADVVLDRLLREVETRPISLFDMPSTINRTTCVAGEIQPLIDVAAKYKELSTAFPAEDKILAM
jgi:hypothetical protein